MPNLPQSAEQHEDPVRTFHFLIFLNNASFQMLHLEAEKMDEADDGYDVLENRGEMVARVRGGMVAAWWVTS